MNTGKLMDVLIEDDIYDVDLQTGMKTLSSVIIVWADEGKTELIKKIPGIAKAWESDSNGKYCVFLDPRYSREFLKEEIKAQLLISD